MSDQKIVDRADLQKFTKDELIDYILAVSFMLRRPPLSPITALLPPARTILEFRAEKIHKEIDKNLRETDDLIAATKNFPF